MKMAEIMISDEDRGFICGQMINELLKKEMFEYNAEKEVFTKNKQFHSSIGLEESTNEIFIRKDFIIRLSELIIKQFGLSVKQYMKKLKED